LSPIVDGETPQQTLQGRSKREKPKNT